MELKCNEDAELKRNSLSTNWGLTFLWKETLHYNAAAVFA